MATLTRTDLVGFIRRHPIAVEATASPSAPPQAAAIGIVASDDLEIFFDTLETSRKCLNLHQDRRIALVA